MKCPFYLTHNLDAKSGKTACPECSAKFEVDDRLECVFVDTQKMRLPVIGFVCGGYADLFKVDKGKNVCIVEQN